VIPKPIFEEIHEADIAALIDAGIPEGRTLEYKRELPDFSDAGKVKFLRIVTSFANTAGGDVIYGIDASSGIPQRVSALNFSSMDETIQRLESLAANAVDPRLPRLMFRPISLSGGGYILVIRVDRSWFSPHRVIVGGHAHFYGRNSAGSYQLDVSELRRAFSFSESIAERIRSFRSERILMIGSGNTPVPLMAGAKVVLHLLPLSSFTERTQVSVVPDSDVMSLISPTGSTAWSYRMNLDGRLSYAQHGDGLSRAYAQVYRNGIIESAFAVEKHESTDYLYNWYEEWLVESIQNYMNALDKMGVVAPIYACLTFVGIGGYRFHVGSRRLFDEHPADRDVFILPEVQIDDMKTHPAVFMKQSFDTVWNAFGHARSFNYSQSGDWSPPQ
jgi:hypothetical protein